MTIEVLSVFLILTAALVLFFTGWVRMDIVALLVLTTLTVTGLIKPEEALAGFSNPAVVTVWAMFILSAGLYQTGVAKIIGRRILHLAGESEWRMILVIMLSSGLLSAVMNNIGVAALMLPVVMDIARSTDRPPSRLLMPLAYGCLLGGLTTLIGTPPNLLVSFALEDAGLQPFGLFDFTPLGLSVMLGGIFFIALIGRHVLPSRNVVKKRSSQKALTAYYSLQERTFLMKVKSGSELAGKTLAESRLRAALGINVLSVKREGGGVVQDPGPNTVLRARDKLFVQGRYQAIKALKEWKILIPDHKDFDPEKADLEKLNFFEAQIPENSSLVGQNLNPLKIHKLYKVNVLAIRRSGVITGKALQKQELRAGDVLLIHGNTQEVTTLESSEIVARVQPVSGQELMDVYKLHQSIFIMEVREDSELFGSTPSDSQLGEAFGFVVLGILRGSDQLIMPKPGEKFEQGDHLLVQGNVKDLPLLKGLMGIELLDEEAPAAQSLESRDVMMAEVVLAPRSMLAGKTLRDINFRNKYGLTVLAIWREGRAYRTNFHNMDLRPGEALLLYGKKEKLELIDQESDFILLSESMQQPFRTHKAPAALMVMLAVLVPVLFGVIPLAISAIMGIALMVLTGCLKMEEAYRAIEWRSVFLIAGLLPLGVAMQQTGAAELMAQAVVDIFGRFGPWGVVAGLYLFTLISTLVIHPAALVVIMSPVAIQTATSFGISPYSIMMAISIAAAGSFLSPISHPANLLVMGPGGYKFSDYLKLGLPLSLVVMALVMLLLPVFWPF